MFKNAIIYTVTPGFRFDPDLLGRRPARSCGASEQRTDGFIAPCDHSTAGLVHAVAGHQLICWQTKDKLLPGSVVADAVAQRIEQIEKDHARKVGRKEARDIKDQVVDELLPKAFVQHRSTFAVLTGRYFIIDTSSSARADDMISAIIKALDGTLPMRPLQTNVSPIHAMTGWVAENEAPADFSIDDTLELRAAGESAAAIRYVNHDIGGPEVARHVAAGKIAVKLGMTHGDRLSFILDDKLHVRRLAFLDIVTERAEKDPQTAQEYFDADVTILTGELVALIDRLVQELGGLPQAADDLVTKAEGDEIKQRKAA